MMLREAVEQASKRADVREAIARVYVELQQEIDLRRPKCEMSGRCCRFDEYGHRLYVTTMELAAFFFPLPAGGERGRGEGTGVSHEKLALDSKAALEVERTDSRDYRARDSARTLPLSLALSPFRGEGKMSCPFQENRLCSVHTIRPFGCRIFFCDETATQWQQEQYERFHARIKRLHEELEVPYFYVEWRAALRELEAIVTAG